MTLDVDRRPYPKNSETSTSKDTTLLEDWIRVYEAYGFKEVASYRLAKITNAFFAPLSKPILEITACFTYIRKWLSLKKAMRTNPDFDIDLGACFVFNCVHFRSVSVLFSSAILLSHDFAPYN